MSKIKIDKGVPIPKAELGRNRKYPWDELQVGDSFFVPGKTRATFNGFASRFKKTHGIHFTLRTVTENDIKGVRIWRIK